MLVAAIAAVASPAAAVLTAAAIGGTGAIGFAATAASRRWRGEPHSVGPLGPLHAAGGFYLAALSAGSLCGGLVYGARSWRGAPSRRLTACLLGIAAGCALIAAASVPVTVAAATLAVGLMLAPTTVICSALLDITAPAGTVTEAFAVLVMGIVVGTAVGNAVGGAIVDSASYRTAAVAAAGIAVLGAATAWARRRTLLRGG